MKKFMLVGGIAVVVLGAGAGGALMFLHHGGGAATARTAARPKPIVFAELDDIVVSIPVDSGDPPSAFVQFAVQFATTDPNAVTSFTALEPIIKSDIISRLMSETGKSLQDPAMREKLTKDCLAISNSVLAHNANSMPANPFTAAYITNLVVQD